MAINTRSRRAAILGLAQAITLTLPLSDGTVGQEDRQHVAFCYPGIQAATPIPIITAIIALESSGLNPELNASGTYEELEASGYSGVFDADYDS